MVGAPLVETTLSVAALEVPFGPETVTATGPGVRSEPGTDTCSWLPFVTVADKVIVVPP